MVKVVPITYDIGGRNHLKFPKQFKRALATLFPGYKKGN